MRTLSFNMTCVFVPGDCRRHTCCGVQRQNSTVTMLFSLWPHQVCCVHQAWKRCTRSCIHYTTLPVMYRRQFCELLWDLTVCACSTAAHSEVPHADHIRQMAITAPDLPTTDVAQYFHPSYTFIEEAVAAGRAVLVHCGAGSSRSATVAAGAHATDSLSRLLRVREPCSEAV